MIHINALPHVFGPVLGNGKIKSVADDFMVREHLGFAPSGEGEHVWLQVEKRLANTDWVAGVLAKHAGIKKRDVGYSGKKDKYAVTRQWFSFTMSNQEEPNWNDIESQYDGRIVVLKSARHIRKLKRGWHKYNIFKITARDLAIDECALAHKFQQLAIFGFPNYFMQQRFGNDEKNLQLTNEIASGKLKYKPKQHGILLSSARSFLFNQALAARIHDQQWGVLQTGDLVQFDNNRSTFVLDELNATLSERHQQRDLHATAPLWGRGLLSTTGVVQKREQALMRQYPELCWFLEQTGLTMDRRAIRAVPKKLRWKYENNMLTLVFALRSGAYATALIRELFNASE